MIRVEVCGGIATGKTALVNHLIYNNAYKPVWEKYREVPFWEKFYRDPVNFALEKNISFLLFHGDAIREAMGARSQNLICDFAMFQDLAYAQLSSEDVKDLEVINALYERILVRIGLPDIIIRLKCAPATQLERIQRRGRSVEISILEEYLIRLNSNIDRSLQALVQITNTPVLDIDTDQCDFVTNPEALLINARLNGLADLIKGA